MGGSGEPPLPALTVHRLSRRGPSQATADAGRVGNRNRAAAGERGAHAAFPWLRPGPTACSPLPAPQTPPRPRSPWPHRPQPPAPPPPARPQDVPGSVWGRRRFPGAAPTPGFGIRGEALRRNPQVDDGAWPHRGGRQKARAQPVCVCS